MRDNSVHTIFIITVALFSCATTKEETVVEKPNVIVFYVDDLGYGDVAVGLTDEPQLYNLDEDQE